MSWRALRNNDGTIHTPCSGEVPGCLGWGTLVMEINLAALARSRTPLIRLTPRREPEHIFALERTPDGRLQLLRRHGGEVGHLSIGLGREPSMGTLRLSYHWDHHRGVSLMTAENLSKGTIRQQEASHALPLLDEEIAALFGGGGDSHLHPALDWIGLADHWQIVGPMPGLAASTLVETVNGSCPVAMLRPGDMVLTADDGSMPVLWQGRVSVPAIGSFRPVRILAPCFGLARDMVVLPGQRLALSGADVEYHFGEEEVLIEARHLANGQTGVWEPEAEVTACHGVLFDRHALIRADGLWTESLYLGRIARNPDLARSIAPGALVETGSLPIHTGPARRELMDYEALALMLSMLNSRSVVAA
ncbi:Hint domain-containing protein [Defluviimonas aestuarii]|uniref:Hint domain-containing protein n=1 Tax=Albidovulum aestuarii TaxID=1130726 RepID=UPI00249C0F83|nr:Hint domain-containing protein [Defluviimonas aestuarii]MDI3337673.1 Hint domain-containing protein [Defluviimonas aestuarii]